MAKRKRKNDKKKKVQFRAVKSWSGPKLLNGQKKVLGHSCCTRLGDGCRNDRSLKTTGGGNELMMF